MSEKTMHLSQNSAATGTLDLEIQRLRKVATDAFKEANLLDEKATLLSKETLTALLNAPCRPHGRPRSGRPFSFRFP